MDSRYPLFSDMSLDDYAGYTTVKPVVKVPMVSKAVQPHHTHQTVKKSAGALQREDCCGGIVNGGGKCGCVKNNSKDCLSLEGEKRKNSVGAMLRQIIAPDIDSLTILFCFILLVLLAVVFACGYCIRAVNDLQRQLSLITTAMINK